MQSTARSQIVFLAPELQVSCFNALGHVEGSLNDAFHLAETCKTLYTVHKKYLPEIARCIIVSKREDGGRHLADFHEL